MVPFMNKFWVDKGNDISTFDVSTYIPHVIGELAKEYFKRTTPNRRGCSTRTVYEYDKEVEEVDDDGPSVGNGAYNTNGVVKNHL